MKSLENRIAKLEQSKGGRTVELFYEITCQFALEQNKPMPVKPVNVIESMKQLAGYLPN